MLLLIKLDCFLAFFIALQRAKKVVSDSTGLVDFAMWPVNSVLDLPDGQVTFWGNSSTIFFGLGEMTFGLIHVSYSLLKWQAVKLTFFAPCTCWLYIFLFHSNFHYSFTLPLFLNSLFSDGALKSLEVNSLLLIFLHLGECYHHYLILSSKLILHLEC